MSDNLNPVLLLTRPQAASERFAALAGKAGIAPADIVISPLLKIDFFPDPIRWNGTDAVIFTSGNGVEAAIRQDAPRMPCHCVGKATAETARQAGWQVRTVAETADGLTDALLKHPVGGNLLHICGENRRGEIVETLCSAGISARVHTAYAQLLLPAPQAAQTLFNGSRPVVLPLFSPRTARHFARIHRGSAPLWLAALSPAVAEPLDCMTPAALEVAETPDAASILSTVLALWRRASRLEDKARDH